MELSKTNRSIKFFAIAFLVMSIIAALIIIFTLKIKEPDEVLKLTGYVIEGDVVPHPMRWLYASIVFGTGLLSSLFLFAISEALSRLQAIEINTEK
jgi:hypothetical protein